MSSAPPGPTKRDVTDEEPGETPPTQKVGVSLNVSSLFAKPWYSVLTSTAKGFVSDHPEAAVVTAQIATEVYAELAFAELTREQVSTDWHDAITELISPMHHDKARKLWVALTGDKTRDTQDPWRSYKAHVARRNKVVHEGARVTPAEAEASVAAVIGLIMHMQKVLEPILKPSDESPASPAL